jgi:hypothetical protein
MPSAEAILFAAARQTKQKNGLWKLLKVISHHMIFLSEKTWQQLLYRWEN